MSARIDIDGAAGEGGGQILRSALALSLVTGRPFRIDRIRAGRAKPGLLRQHLTAVNAAASMSGARVSGAELGSTTLEFTPGRVEGGEYRLAVGTAGSATLVLQAVLPALLVTSRPSRLTLEGGTHNPYARHSISWPRHLCRSFGGWECRSSSRSTHTASIRPVADGSP